MNNDIIFLASLQRKKKATLGGLSPDKACAASLQTAPTPLFTSNLQVSREKFRPLRRCGKLNRSKGDLSGVRFDREDQKSRWRQRC